MVNLKYPNGEESGLFALIVPKDSGFFEVHDRNKEVLSFDPDTKGEYGSWDYIDINSSFKILGTVSKEAIGFDVEPYVGKIDYHGGPYYNNYEGELVMTDDPLISFRSLLSFNSLYLSNPLGYEPQMDKYVTWEKWQKALSEWKSSESKVIKDKILIIQKIK